jgi:hypothetical protein
MLKACLKQKEFYYRFHLDMHKDGYSLPALAENILFQHQISRFDEFIVKTKTPTLGHSPPYLGDRYTSGRIANYRLPDRKAEREFKDEDFAAVKYVRCLLEEANYQCIYCHNAFNDEDWSLDRRGNDIAHLKSNCVISCIDCNTRRKRILFKRFYRLMALERFDDENPLIHLITIKDKDVFYKFKQNICGGLSLIFHRYHEAEETKIQRSEWKNQNWVIREQKNSVKEIFGFDANMLYLWCLGEEQACGELQFMQSEDINSIGRRILWICGSRYSCARTFI